MEIDKEIRWTGSAYTDLLDFPEDARRQAGFQLSRVQAGLDPADWKPFDEIGPGTREIRIRESDGIYRIMYVAKFEEAVYVLHSFRKKRGRPASATSTSPGCVTAPWSMPESSSDEN